MEKTVRVGMMPGKINEFVVEDNTTIEKMLQLAELNPTGYDVKIDGNKVEDLTATIDDANLILLVKQVKGA